MAVAPRAKKSKKSFCANTIDGVREAIGGGALASLFSGSVGPFSISLVWWVALTLLAAFVLDCTPFGNWIFATGGNYPAAARMGV